MPVEPGVGRSRFAGQARRRALPASLGHRPEPFFAPAFPASLESPGRAVRGTPVHRANPCASHSLLRLGTGPSHPWLGRSPGRRFIGPSPFSGSPTGPFAMPRFTHGLGVRRDERPPDPRLYSVHPPDLWLIPRHRSHAPIPPPRWPGRARVGWAWASAAPLARLE